MRTIEEIATSITAIVEAMNSISIEEIVAMRRRISHDETIQPLIDPTGWRDGDMFRVAGQSKDVLEAIQDFKTTVSGIGFFETVDNQTK